MDGLVIAIKEAVLIPSATIAVSDRAAALKREGKEYLKEEIKSAINSFLIEGNVVEVYYVAFQIN